MRGTGKDTGTGAIAAEGGGGRLEIETELAPGATGVCAGLAAPRKEEKGEGGEDMENC